MNSSTIISRYNLDKKTWTHKGFHGVLHYFFPVGEMPLKPFYDYTGESCDLSVFFFHDDYGEWYWDDDALTKFRTMFVNKIKQNPKFLDDLLSEWKNRIKKLDSAIEKIDKTNLENLSNDELLDLYHEWYALYIEEYGIAATFQEGFSFQAEEFLAPRIKKLIKEKHPEHTEDWYLILISPVDESFITQERRNLLNILKEFKKGIDVSNLIKDHTRKYHWIRNNYAKDYFLDEDHFVKKFGEIKDLNPEKELKKLDEDITNIKRKKQEIINSLDFDDETKSLIRATEVVAYMQDERKKYVLMATHYQRVFIEEFGRRLKLSKEHMEYTFIHELKDLLAKKEIDSSIFEERKKFSLVIQTLEGYEIFSGSEAKEIFGSVFEKKLEDISEFKGLIASKGKISGKVKIVKKTHDLINFHKGDILVASMTRPEMVVAMKRAGAIVTDEGGVTSHAAVVSRELGIPCIIGTHVATRVLKDGDQVEVDADSGTVRIIKKA